MSENKFSTMPMSLVDALSDPIGFHEQWNQTLSFEESHDVALRVSNLDRFNAPCDRFALRYLKDGHTASVWHDTKEGRIINVARDRSSASADLISSFIRLEALSLDRRIAEVSRVFQMDGVAFSIVEYVYDSVEMTLSEDMETLGTIRWDRSPMVELLPKYQSDALMEEILDIEEKNKINLSLLHGDVVLCQSGEIRVVGCDGCEDHYTPYTHRKEGRPRCSAPGQPNEPCQADKTQHAETAKPIV